MSKTTLKNKLTEKVYIITGPTSGIGRVTALELAKKGTVILVGRDPEKLNDLKKVIAERGQRALSVVCDLSEISSVKNAVKEIVALNMPIAGLLNNAGTMPMKPKQNSLGWDIAFATNHLGPFAFTESLIPHLPKGAHVVFVVSGVEDPERKPAKAAGFCGGRFISVEASARGEWKPGGAKQPGFDSYATSKQAILAAGMALVSENPQLRINFLEPGFTPNTGLGRDAHGALKFVANYILPLFAPYIKYWSTPKQAGHLSARILTDETENSGIYFDEKGKPMTASKLVQDRKFQDTVTSETRAFLSKLLVKV